ncbi:MAG: winged helix-turn-helix domain-containing protein [bacterium]|nr:winged helix-turn-helix domain-containing protein [bacterium]
MNLAGRPILVVTADAPLGDAVAEQLNVIPGMTPIICSGSRDALDHLRTDRFAAVIADDDLADACAASLWQTLARMEGTVSVIRIGSGTSDDAITKPFRLGTLMARVKELIDRPAHALMAPVEVGPFTFHPETRALVHRPGGTSNRLTEKESLILIELLLAGEVPVDRNTLLERVWGHDTRIRTHTLETHIWRLRRKLGEDRSRARILLNVPGGYRLKT